MKKTFVLLLSLAMVCLLFACAKTDEEGSDSQLPNPVQNSTAQEILDTLGITFNIPVDAQDISYSIINESDANAIAQAVFTLDNIEYTYRIASAAEFSDISGAYYDWTTTKDIEVSYCSGELSYIEGEQGICQWYDTVPGLMYSIYAASGASEESLLSLANKLFVPAYDVP
jgi:hypothetical protein